jgi:uncharacterized protein DUF6677
LSETLIAAAPERRAVSPILAMIAAWAVPGLGHLLLRRWGRACVIFGAIAGLAITGYVLRGVVFPIHLRDFRGDPLTFLGGIGDAGSGIFYALAGVLEKSGADVSRAAGDYGTRFIAAAGVANFLCAADAYEIASGGKE